MGEKNAIGGSVKFGLASSASMDGRIDVDLITEVGSLKRGSVTRDSFGIKSAYKKTAEAIRTIILKLTR